MKNAAGILQFLIDATTRGERAALVTLTGIVGRSSRAQGTQMAVSEIGSYVGSFSGGCVEAAVVSEAQRVIASGVSETIRLGDGSPFIDIKLPCGGGIDLLIVPAPPLKLLNEAWAMLANRVPVTMSMASNGSVAVQPGATGERTEWNGGVFKVVHHPDLHVVIIGHGEEPRALAAMATAYGAIVTVLTPDRSLLDILSTQGVDARHLKTQSRSEDLVSDPYTAVVFLFHDHDWEQALLEQALSQDAFFIGAMGSRTTHRARVDGLRHRGVSESDIHRLVGPVGLVPATRDPETLALSALAQIASLYDAACKSERRSSPPFAVQ